MTRSGVLRCLLIRKGDHWSPLKYIIIFFVAFFGTLFFLMKVDENLIMLLSLCFAFFCLLSFLMKVDENLIMLLSLCFAFFFLLFFLMKVDENLIMSFTGYPLVLLSFAYFSFAKEK